MGGRPQQPELNRSGRTDLDPNYAETALEVAGERAPRDADAPGPVPEANRPGHHPERDQDQPDLDAVAKRLGTKSPVVRAVSVGRAAGRLAALPLRMTAGVLERAARVLDSGEHLEGGRDREHAP